jgi:hypothetical protein
MATECRWFIECSKHLISPCVYSTQWRNELAGEEIPGQREGLYRRRKTAPILGSTGGPEKGGQCGAFVGLERGRYFADEVITVPLVATMDEGRRRQRRTNCRFLQRAKRRGGEQANLQKGQPSPSFDVVSALED